MSFSLPFQTLSTACDLYFVSDLLFFMILAEEGFCYEGM